RSHRGLGRLFLRIFPFHAANTARNRRRNRRKFRRLLSRLFRSSWSGSARGVMGAISSRASTRTRRSFLLRPGPDRGAQKGIRFRLFLVAALSLLPFLCRNAAASRSDLEEDCLRGGNSVIADSSSCPDHKNGLAKGPSSLDVYFSHASDLD